MPLAVVNYQETRIPVGDMVRITEALPGFVALALHVEANPDAHLTPCDIEVWAMPSGPLDVIGPYDLCIFIFANEYPERIPILDDAARQIASSLKELLRGLGYYGHASRRFWVWPFLGKAAFADFMS